MEPKNWLVSLLRKSERYTKTDMVYLFKGGFWLNLNNIISSGLSFILSILFAQYVSKEAYGGYQFLISFASIIGTLTLTGMNAAVTQSVARGFDGVYKDSIRVQIKYAVIPFVAGIISSAYYFIQGNVEISASLIIIAILVPLANTFNTWTSFATAKKDFSFFFFKSFWINFIYLGGMLTTVFFIPNAIALIFTNFIILTIGNWIAHRLILNKYKPAAQSESEAIDYGKKLSVSSILPLIALNIDNILVFHLLGPANLAVYAFASNIPDKFISLIRPISTLAFPKIAVKDLDDSRRNLGSKVLRFFILALLMVFIYIIISPSVYKFFFPKYIDSIIYSQYYIFAAAIAATASFCVSYMFATRSKKIFYYNALNPVVNIGVVVAGAYLFGIWGVIFARIIGNSFSLIYSFILEK